MLAKNYPDVEKHKANTVQKVFATGQIVSGTVHKKISFTIAQKKIVHHCPDFGIWVKSRRESDHPFNFFLCVSVWVSGFVHLGHFIVFLGNY